MGFENLTLEVRDGLAHLTLNRPNSANAFNLDLAREFEQAATICAAQSCSPERVGCFPPVET